MKKSLIILGAGGHGLSVGDIALTNNYEIEFFVDKNQNVKTLLNTPVVPEIPEKYLDADCEVFIAVGNNAARQEIYSELQSLSSRFKFPNLIHPRANLSENIALGKGIAVFAGATINVGSKIDNFCVINTNSSVDHETHMRDYSSIAPGVNLGGRVTLGNYSFVGIGASVKHDINIGENVVIGANSYVNIDLSDNVLAFGSPVKIIRKRTRDETYF